MFYEICPESTSAARAQPTQRSRGRLRLPVDWWRAASYSAVTAVSARFHRVLEGSGRYGRVNRGSRRSLRTLTRGDQICTFIRQFTAFINIISPSYIINKNVPIFAV